MVKNKIKKELKILDKIVLYAVVLILLLALLFLLIHNASSNYHAFKGNKNYFNNNTKLQVEDWMTPHTIIEHFNITEEQFFKETQIKKTEANLRTPLYEICKRDRIDCNSIVTKINQLLE